MLAGFSYPHTKPLHSKAIVDKINNCVDGRHYRLLTSRELDLLNDFIKEDLAKIF